MSTFKKFLTWFCFNILAPIGVPVIFFLLAKKILGTTEKSAIETLYTGGITIFLSFFIFLSLAPDYFSTSKTDKNTPFLVAYFFIVSLTLLIIGFLYVSFNFSHIFPKPISVSFSDNFYFSIWVCIFAIVFAIGFKVYFLNQKRKEDMQGNTPEKPAPIMSETTSKTADRTYNCEVENDIIIMNQTFLDLNITYVNNQINQ